MLIQWNGGRGMMLDAGMVEWKGKVRTMVVVAMAPKILPYFDEFGEIVSPKSKFCPTFV